MGKDQRVSEDSKDALTNGAGLSERVRCIFCDIIENHTQEILSCAVGWEDWFYGA